MTKNLIFEFQDYKGYLHSRIRAEPKGGRGVRVALARALACPVSHISQVLNQQSHLTPEQAELVNQYFAHTSEEAAFFLLLLQLARAGTPLLKNRLQQQIDQTLERRFTLKERLGVRNTLSSEDQATFFGSWLYGAVHVALTIESCRTKGAIAKRLGVSESRVSEILEFLTSVGLATESENGRYEIGTSRIHLGNDSALIAKFHTNWRIQAIRSFDNDSFKEDLHYSSVVTISKTDRKRVREILVSCVEEIKGIVRDSKEEEIQCFALDLFGI